MEKTNIDQHSNVWSTLINLRLTLIKMNNKQCLRCMSSNRLLHLAKIRVLSMVKCIWSNPDPHSEVYSLHSDQTLIYMTAWKAMYRSKSLYKVVLPWTPNFGHQPINLCYNYRSWTRNHDWTEHGDERKQMNITFEQLWAVNSATNIYCCSTNSVNTPLLNNAVAVQLLIVFCRLCSMDGVSFNWA